MTSRNRLLAACTLSLLATTLAAQERGRYAGWVADANGKRVVGANVTLISRPLPKRPDIGETDELHVQTAADGMFRAKLLHGRSYSAWAVWRDDSGIDHRTEIAENVFPGPPSPLKETARQTLTTIRITGADKWLTHAPLRLTAITASENISVLPLQLADDMTAKLPTLPGATVDLEVRGKTGLVLSMANSKRLAQADETTLTIALSEPHELRVIVHDNNGKPVPDVLVRHAFGYRLRDAMAALGTTDEKGTLDCRIPSHNPTYMPNNHDLCVLEITAPGRQRRQAWTKLGKVGNEVTLTMPTGPDLLGSVAGAKGSAAETVTLLPDCYAMGGDNESTGTGVPPRPLALFDDGSFRFHGLHPKYDFRLLALIEPKAAIELGLNLRPDVAVAPIMWLAVGAPPYQLPHKLAPIDLAKLEVAQIRVTTNDGVPAPGAHVTVTTKDLYNSPMNYVCDRVGRLQFPLPIGTIHIGAWAPNAGIATTLVTSNGIQNGKAQPPLVIKLSATRTIHGTIVDENGQPMAGLKAYQWNRAQIEDRKLREMSYLGRATSNTTGADGKFSLTLPLDDTSFVIRTWGRINEINYTSESVPIAPDESDTGFRIVVSPVKKK